MHQRHRRRGRRRLELAGERLVQSVAALEPKRAAMKP
jgi:hypothetical protein